MNRIVAFLKQIFLHAPQTPLSSEELRAAFQKRYENFKNLLTANNNALQAMAELEKIYYGGESYRMAMIHPRITTIQVNVYKMIQNLLAMSDGKYTELERIFETISDNLNQIIENKPPLREGPFVLPLEEVNSKEKKLVGDKMANIGEIASLPGIRVPCGFSITASATRHFLTSKTLLEINRRLQILNLDDIDQLYKTCNELKNIVMDTLLPADLEELLHLHYCRLEKAVRPDCRVALRSSAHGEDAAGVSFAGLYRTVLDVNRDTLGNAYKEVVASKYGARAISYRRKRGFRHEDIEMCVGCMVMVDALISGVIYSRDLGEPDSDLIRINSAMGIAKGVVDGTAVIDLFLVSRDKPFSVVYSEMKQGQINRVEKDGAVASLTYSQIKQLAQTAILLEDHFGGAQDIEWSFDHQGQLYILQSRPMLVRAPVEIKKHTAASEDAATSEAPLMFGGVCASDGVACGEVFFVNSCEEMNKFPQGGVLVIEQPIPEWAPLLSTAIAVISEKGSEVGHLATVSREFGIPALFSLPGATTKLENGQKVTVNSSGRTVYQGVRDDLLKMIAVRKDIMSGSPVQQILAKTLRHITPLNLNDPASSRFKSSWCETLHDITRFCHEKSVSEMFNFGQKHHFDRGTAKRLIGGASLEWWVIDLADGLRKGFDGASKTVSVEDIISYPMLAIWKGISAVTWEGPPPISAKGFGSIIFQSTMRPDIDPTVPSALTTKNVFLISGNFCNLSVRLGYHYAMIEAYVSDLLTESYVTFRFKGGAADLRRKAVRAKLLADILEKYGFQVELHSDALLARVKKKSREYLEKRLRILGYLTLHARQLDMVMNQPQSVGKYRNKFLSDIEAMLSEGNGKTSEVSDHE